MRAGVKELCSELEKAPEDWSIRIRLIEAAGEAGDLTEARRLVRSSPDDWRHLQVELQDRIHSILFRMIPPVEPVFDLPRAEED